MNSLIVLAGAVILANDPVPQPGVAVHAGPQIVSSPFLGDTFGAGGVVSLDVPLDVNLSGVAEATWASADAYDDELHYTSTLVGGAVALRWSESLRDGLGFHVQAGGELSLRQNEVERVDSYETQSQSVGFGGHVAAGVSAALDRQIDVIAQVRGTNIRSGEWVAIGTHVGVRARF